MAKIVYGRGLISSQPESDSCDLDHGEEVGREFFVACGDAPELAELVKAARGKWPKLAVDNEPIAYISLLLPEGEPGKPRSTPEADCPFCKDGAIIATINSTKTCLAWSLSIMAGYRSGLIPKSVTKFIVVMDLWSGAIVGMHHWQ